MNGNGVQDEFLRLMRAIYDSLERESELQRQLRRTKEALVSVALRLQVAIKLSKEDEQTLAQLTAEAEESKARELDATKRADEAVTLIRALTIEVNSLKRKLKAYETEKADIRVDKSSSGITLHQQAAMNEAADAEVDAMLEGTNNRNNNNNNGSSPLSKSQQRASIALRNVSELALKTATPFDKWKMAQFLFTPDTPAASLEHDKHVVDILMESATQELIDDIRSKRTYSSLGKVKKLQKRITNEQDRSKMMSMTAHPANDYEGLFLPDTVTGINSVNLALSQEQSSLEQPLPPLNATEKELADFFLSTGVEQKWGNRQTFDHGNLARVNLWASNDQLHPVNNSKSKSNENNSRSKAGGSSIKSPVKLQSQTQSSSSSQMYKSH